MATDPGSARSYGEIRNRSVSGWWLVVLGAGTGVGVGIAWLALTGLSDFDTPSPGLRSTAWVVLLVGVAVAAIPAALGFRRLHVRGWIATYLLGLLVATPAALVVVVPNV
jgi:hypothetical protein